MKKKVCALEGRMIKKIKVCFIGVLVIIMTIINAPLSPINSDVKADEIKATNIKLISTKAVQPVLLTQAKHDTESAKQKILPQTAGATNNNLEFLGFILIIFSVLMGAFKILRRNQVSQ